MTAITRHNRQKIRQSLAVGRRADIVESVQGREAANVTGPDGGPVQGSSYSADRCPPRAAGPPGEINVAPNSATDAVLRKIARQKWRSLSDLNCLLARRFRVGQNSNVTRSASEICYAHPRLQNYGIVAYSYTKNDGCRGRRWLPIVFCSRYIVRHEGSFGNNIEVGDDSDKAFSDNSDSRAARRTSREPTIEKR